LRFIEDEVTVIFLSNLNITPVSHLTKEIAKVVFEEKVTLPSPLKSIPLKNPHEIVGNYQVENDQSKMVRISEKRNELYLITSKMYGVPYKYRLIPVEERLYKTTFLTEFVNEKVILHYSRTSGKIEYVQYIDLYGEEYICYPIEF
ncbi:MAG: hypothetical protein RR565_11320, partial [Erysipelothrix sp.]